MKISRILLGAAVVVAMTACGGANENKDAENANGEATEVVAEETAVETPAGDAAEATEATEAPAENTEAPADATEAPADAPAADAPAEAK